jgi:hypothetical protein
MTHRPPIFCLLLTTSLLSGCGYQQSGASGDFGSPSTGYKWHSLYREDIRSVAVPIFATKDFRRGYEFRLTEAIIKNIEATTPYKVVSRERADTILEGEVLSVRSNTINNDIRSSLPQERLMTVTVSFTWKDLRSGRILVERHNFDQSASFFPPQGEGEFVGSQQAIERLALSIVQELQADW